MTELAFRDHKALCQRGINGLIKTPLATPPLGDYVFVYGTLKNEFINNDFLEGASLIGDAVTRHRYPMAVLHMCPPFMIPMEGMGSRIKGEMWMPTTLGCWRALDRLEKNGVMYQRKKIEVGCKDLRYVAWAYFLINPMPGDLDPKCWKDEYTKEDCGL